MKQNPWNTIKEKRDFGDMLFSCIWESILLVTAVSVDAFTVGLVYGAGRIKVPLVSVLIVTGVSGAVLGAALTVGSLLGSLLPGGATRYVSFAILFVLGLISMLDRSRHHEAEQANKNRDTMISPGEAAALGTALSVDSLGVGVGAGVSLAQIPMILIVSFFIGALAIWSGDRLGRMASARCPFHLCWLSGVLLLLLAFWKLV